MSYIYLENSSSWLTVISFSLSIGISPESFADKKKLLDRAEFLSLFSISIGKTPRSYRRYGIAVQQSGKGVYQCWRPHLHLENRLYILPPWYRFFFLPAFLWICFFAECRSFFWLVGVRICDFGLNLIWFDSQFPRHLCWREQSCSLHTQTAETRNFNIWGGGEFLLLLCVPRLWIPAARQWRSSQLLGLFPWKRHSVLLWVRCSLFSFPSQVERRNVHNCDIGWSRDCGP